jgi:hypothetical protein
MIHACNIYINIYPGIISGKRFACGKKIVPETESTNLVSFRHLQASLDAAQELLKSVLPEVKAVPWRIPRGGFVKIEPPGTRDFRLF